MVGQFDIAVFFKQYNYFLRWDLLEDKILYVFVCMSKSFEFQFSKITRFYLIHF